MEFKNGSELLRFRCSGYIYGIRWSDWGEASKTDLDVSIYDTTDTSQTPKLKATGDQVTLNPVEMSGWRSNCSHTSTTTDWDYLAIKIYSAGADTNDVVEFMAHDSDIEHSTNPYSVTQPFADSASGGVLTTGAIDPPTGYEIAVYSSQGPTNDGRIKPDLSAVSCLKTYAYSPGCFGGTSAATPVVAGAAALILGADLASTPTAVKTWILNNAIADRGTAGADNVFGHGELIMPAPPAEPADADLGVTVTDSPDPVELGGTVTYTTTAKNHGPGSASSVSVTFDTPLGLDVTSISSTKGTCSGGITANNWFCTIGDLTSGSTATITVKGTAQDADSVMRFIASITGAETDPNAANGSASAQTNVGSGLTGPDAPRNVAGQPSDGKVKVTWSPPADDGGSPITGYVISAQHTTQQWTTNASARSITITGLTNGRVYRFQVRAVNDFSVGDLATTAKVLVGMTFDADPKTTERVDATSPTTAAIEVSKARFAPDAAKWVVLSRDDTFPDSLAGTALIDSGPMLLTASSTLTSATAKEIARALPDGGLVYLLGGEVAISRQVASDLQGRGYTVKRLGGDDRVTTALAIADEVRQRRPGEDRAAIARAWGPPGNDTAAWADSVTSGAWAAETGVPVLLTPSDHLHPSVDAWLRKDAPSRTILLGGPVALFDAVQESVPNPKRVWGAERDDTAAEIAKQLWGVSTTGQRRFVIVNGYRADGWAFGLPAAGMGATQDAPVLLTSTDGVPDGTIELATACDTPKVDILVAGSTTIIPDARLAELAAVDGARC